MRPPVETRVGAVADWLLSTFGGFNGWEVFDGRMPSTPGGGNVIIVGPDSPESFNVTNRKMPGLGVSYEETIRVVCVLWSWTGDSVVKPSRHACVSGLGLVRTALDPDTGDQTLGGACDLAVVGPDMSWLQGAAQNGLACSVGFTIQAVTMI
jgi:hypothetical protein